MFFLLAFLRCFLVLDLIICFRTWTTHKAVHLLLFFFFFLSYQEASNSKARMHFHEKFTSVNKKNIKKIDPAHNLERIWRIQIKLEAPIWVTKLSNGQEFGMAHSHEKWQFFFVPLFVFHWERERGGGDSLVLVLLHFPPFKKAGLGRSSLTWQYD